MSLHTISIILLIIMNPYVGGWGPLSFDYPAAEHEFPDVPGRHTNPTENPI